ncbi:MAG: hypothetical protein PWP27_197 [Clostridiales bacterium]|nr:hypothetical protein [Clostridiales bacterium]
MAYLGNVEAIELYQNARKERIEKEDKLYYLITCKKCNKKFYTERKLVKLCDACRIENKRKNVLKQRREHKKPGKLRTPKSFATGAKLPPIYEEVPDFAVGTLVELIEYTDKSIDGSQKPVKKHKKLDYMIDRGVVIGKCKNGYLLQNEKGIQEFVEFVCIKIHKVKLVPVS